LRDKLLVEAIDSGTFSTLSEIERGHQNISLTNIGKIARALKVNPIELFKGVH